MKPPSWESWSHRKEEIQKRSRQGCHKLCEFNGSGLFLKERKCWRVHAWIALFSWEHNYYFFTISSASVVTKKAETSGLSLSDSTCYLINNVKNVLSLEINKNSWLLPQPWGDARRAALCLHPNTGERHVPSAYSVLAARHQWVLL